MNPVSDDANTAVLEALGNAQNPALSPNALGTAGSAMALAEAFAEFVSTSSRLELSYRQLQTEVSGLRIELAERNAALQSSLSENQRVRLALQQIVNSMPCGVLVAGHDGRISMMNPETARILCLKTDLNAAVATTLAEIEALSGLHLTPATASDSDSEQELCLRNADGERWLQVGNRYLVPHENADGAQAQTIFILRDITAHKRAERDREAGRNAMALAEITSMLAHEIRNPLGSLELFAELIEQDDTRRADWISNLRAGIRSLSGTVNNVLSLHDSGSLKLSPVSLDETVSSTIRFIQPLADQSGVFLAWQCGAGNHRLMGNASALQQVLLNLITNAIRHTPPAGTVTVSLRAKRGAEPRLLLECSDTGSGIRPEQIGRLFEPGFSGSGDTPGLGLAVSDRIIRQHQGTISAFNLPNAGACFHLEFPVLESVTA